MSECFAARELFSFLYVLVGAGGGGEAVSSPAHLDTCIIISAGVETNCRIHGGDPAAITSVRPLTVATSEARAVAGEGFGRLKSPLTYRRSQGSNLRFARKNQAVRRARAWDYNDGWSR